MINFFIIVPFPFVDAATSKRRPTAVISNRDFNQKNGHVLLAMITTAANSFWPSDVRLTDLASAGLSHSSVIRMKVFTLPEGLIIRSIGELGGDDNSALRQCLSETVPSL